MSCIKVEVVLEIIIEFLDLLNKISSHFFNITELLFCEMNLYEKFKNPNFKVFFPFFYLFSFDNEFVFYRVPYNNITSVPFNITCAFNFTLVPFIITCVPFNITRVPFNITCVSFNITYLLCSVGRVLAS